MDEGIDAVIVDSVLKIRNGLTKNAAKVTESTPSFVNGVSGVNGLPVI